MGENEKAFRYIAQLDEARCNGRWHELPELARKVEKHAPHRACLALTARAEAQVATYNETRPLNLQSSPADELSKFIPPLLTAVDQESDYAQDAFQATICLGWLHWVLDEPQLAAARFPRDFGAQLYRLSNIKTELQGWTKVCIVKGAYLKGFSQEKMNQVSDGVQTYISVLPFLASLDSLSSASPQFKLYTEWLLSRLCLLSDQSSASAPPVDSTQALQVFRIWGRLFEIRPGQLRMLAVSSAPQTLSTRRRVWKAYYDTLSAILQQDLPYNYPNGGLAPRAAERNEKDADELINIRLQQRAELRRVETLYEAQLLEETRFPKSNQNNAEIETWVDSVMDNWRVLCGPSWSDEDLGEGGKPAVGREVLDILYRAATKTFHSTQILRHLFTVHASLAEFELAFNAFNSYAEIVARGKERAEKNGEEDLTLDDDDTILLTAAEAIRILCRFGGQDEAEKALEIGHTLENWLKQHAQHPLESSSYSTDDTLQEIVAAQVLPTTLATAYRAIGISQAHFARTTYDASSRRKIQTEAVRNFEKALDPKLEDPNDPGTLYALGLVMAEMRNIPGAIKILKHALNNAGQYDADGVMQGDDSSPDFMRERKLIPLWHLLGLLLTARSEFFTAGKACEAAFEQFRDPLILFGNPGVSPLYKSSHLNELRMAEEKGHHGLVDRMDTFEKERIIQVKLTQLALLEEQEGAIAAVDASDELLALYGRLFRVEKPARKPGEQPNTTRPPKSSAGTIKGSIFRRPRTSHKSAEMPSSTSPTASERPRTANTRATPTPAIQVTDEDYHPGKPSRQTSLRDPSGHAMRRSHSAKLRKKSAGSLRKPSTEVGSASGTVDQEYEVPPLNSERARAASVASKHSRHLTNQSISSSIAPSVDMSEQPLRNIAHNAPHEAMPPPPGHSRQPPRQDVRLPAPFPRVDATPLEPLFPGLQERRHNLSLLVDLWLFICGLYTRAELYEDAKEAIHEASSLVTQIEEEITRESSSSKALSEKGWGGGKSVEELWGDVFAARGDLTQAQSLPHSALEMYEKALSHFPDHPSAIVGLCTILLDIYCGVIPPEAPRQTGALTPSLHSPPFNNSASADEPGTQRPSHRSKHGATPSELNRLAARDRAYGLLSSLTKLGTGWDYSDAWFMLARAYEEGGQIEKAKEVLWWCVELEETKPIRHWHAAGSGALVL